VESRPPILKGAIDAAEIIKQKKGELISVKTSKNPPTSVRLTLSAVRQMIWFPTDWKGGQRFLAQPNNMAILMDLHNQPIKKATLRKLQVYLNDSEFTEDKVAEQSDEASCLC
jgi:hypothetical protein